MMSRSEIKDFHTAWGVDFAPARRRLWKARLWAMQKRCRLGVRRAKGLPTPDAEHVAVLILPEVVDSRTMKAALLHLAEWSRDGRVSWSRSIEEERKLDAEYLRAMKLEVERLCCRPEDIDR